MSYLFSQVPFYVVLLLDSQDGNVLGLTHGVNTAPPTDLWCEDNEEDDSA